MRKPLMTAVSAGILVGVLVLAGCSAGESQDHQGHDSGSMASSAGAMSDSPMDHPMDGGPAPAGIKAVSAPKFPIGSQVMLTADHMAGMDGARATIVGAFDTYTYSVNFTPTTGGQPVKDHKWVVQQEIKTQEIDVWPMAPKSPSGRSHDGHEGGEGNNRQLHRPDRIHGRLRGGRHEDDQP